MGLDLPPISLYPLAKVFNSFSIAAWKLKTAVLKVL
jgi:hypothetical protein